MSKIRLLTKIIIISLPLMGLTACGSHGTNTSENYHINSMQRVDKNAGNMDKERMKRMENMDRGGKGPN